MIAGKQIREARALLEWSSTKLAQVAKLDLGTVRRAQSMDGEAPITIFQAAKIKSALEAAGVEFAPENSNGAGVRIRAKS